jgi:predicted PurR-regulated permease PerM
MKNDKEWKKWVFWFSFAVAAIAVYKLLDNFTEIINAIGGFLSLLKPFLFAAILAYLLYIPCKKIEDTFNETKLKFLKKHRRGLSVFTVYIIGFIVIFIIINFVFPAASKSVTDLANNIPGYYGKAIEFFESAPDGSITSKIASTNLIQELKNMNIGEVVKNFVSLDRISTYIQSILGATGVIFDIFVTIVVSIYLLLERKDIKSFLKNVCKVIFSSKTYDKISRYYRKTNSIFYNYVLSQVLDAFIVGIISAIALTIMKVKYGIVLGFMIGVFNLIPYFGAIIGIGIAIIITIFTGGFKQAIILAVVIIILQQIDANIINPKILGNSLSLSPILVIFGVTIGGAYFGILGMFLGVPVVALIKIIIVDTINERNEEKDSEKAKLEKTEKIKIENVKKEK